MNYGSNHQLFLRYMMKHGYVSTEKALKICEKLDNPEIKTLRDLEKLISEINDKMEKQLMRISFTRCEHTETLFVVFNDIANDDISKFQARFSPADLEYFQALLKNLVVSDDKQLAHEECTTIALNLTQKLSSSKAESVLEKWTQMGYLISDDNVYLGPRCISEFTPYFKQYYKDYINDCGSCSKLVFKGKHCGHCRKTVHFYCIENKQNCPNCQKSYHDNNHGDDSDDNSI